MNDITNPMAHEEAEKMMAVDRYLLNDLTPEQTVRFEEHYFECAMCADAVVAGQAFVAGIRSANDEASESWWKRLIRRLAAPILIPAWGAWSIAAGGAACLGVLTIQQTYAPPMAANTVLLAEETTKGPDDDKAYALKTPSATVEVPLPYDAPRFPFYRMRIINSDNGKTLSQTLPAPPQESEHTLSVQVASQSLGTGRFKVTVEGLDSSESKQAHPLGEAAYYFEVKANHK